jgi:hypothetical protein
MKHGTNLRIANLLAIVLVALSCGATVAFAIEAPVEVDLGDLEPGTTVTGSFTISNPGSQPVELSLLSSDQTLTLAEDRLTIAANGELDMRFELGVSDDHTDELVRIVTILPENGDPLTVVIRGQGPAPTPQQISETAPRIAVYMDVTCPKCRQLVDDTIPEAFGDQPVLIEEFDILVPENMETLLARLERVGLPLIELPVAFVEPPRPEGAPAVRLPITLQGFDGIERGITIVSGTAGAITVIPTTDAGPAAAQPAVTQALTVGAIVGAGLIDGINPCAFSTMLFLISMLAVAGKTKREILLIGIVYTLTVFVGYVLAGFGLFAGVRSLMVFPTLVSVMRWTLFALLLVLAGLSVRDAVLAAQGRTSEMTLQLPDKFKRRVHGVVRSGTRSASLIGGTIVLGVGVTIFEFSCTGQVYVPVIMHLARTGSGTAVGLLFLYNLAFIIPLLIVFGLAYAGVSMKKVGTMFADRLVLVKLGLAVVFAGFAVLTVVM